MTRKHAIYFWFWKIRCGLLGFRVGTIVKIWSQEKDKYIKGCISSIAGESITNSTYDFYFGVNLFEPIQGNDSRYFKWGSYYLKSFTYNPIDKTYYNKWK